KKKTPKGLLQASARLHNWLMVGRISPRSHASRRRGLTLILCAAATTLRPAAVRAQVKCSGLTAASICSGMTLRIGSNTGQLRYRTTKFYLQGTGETK